MINLGRGPPWSDGGVNGTGKTTTTGKLAHQLSRELGLRGCSVAADTFRAAAVEQLELWASAPGRNSSADPTARIRDPSPIEGGDARRETEADVVIVDTAGRLHTQDDLMEELAKIRRVIAKQIPEPLTRRS